MLQLRMNSDLPNASTHGGHRRPVIGVQPPLDAPELETGVPACVGREGSDVRPRAANPDQRLRGHASTCKYQHTVSRSAETDCEFDLIYVNGDNNLENLKAPDDTWKVRLTEEDFHRLMFDTEGV